MNNVKRNKKILEYLNKQLKRLKMDTNVLAFYEAYIVPNVPATEVINFTIDHNLLDTDGLLIETLKTIGIMEISKDEKDFQKNIEKRDKIKGKKQELTDFDKILKGIMKVPNKEKK